MHEIDSTPDPDPENNQGQHNPDFSDNELSVPLDEIQLAREVQRLVDFVDVGMIPQMLANGFEEHDDGDYFEIEALGQLKDQLAQFLGLREASPFEQEEDNESFLPDDFDNEPDADPRRNLEPANLDFEIHRTLVKRDESGDIMERAIFVEPRILDEDGTVWCFPDIMRNSEGQQLLSRETKRSPVLMKFHSEVDGISFSVHFSDSAIEELFHDAARDLRTLPPSLKNDIGALAIQFCRQIEWPGSENLGLSDIQLRQPRSVNPDENSFDVTIEPLGIFQVSLKPDPKSFGVNLSMRALELFSPMG